MMTRLIHIHISWPKRTLLLLILLVLQAVSVPSASASTAPGKDAGRLYEQLVNGDIRELRLKGNAMIRVNPDSSLMYFSAAAARYDENLPDSDKDACINTSVIFESLLTASRSQVFNPLKI